MSGEDDKDLPKGTAPGAGGSRWTASGTSSSGLSSTSAEDALDLVKTRDEFLQSFIKSPKFGEQLVKAVDSMQLRLTQLEKENAQLRSQVEEDEKIRQLAQRIETLEAERNELLSRFREAEKVSSQFSVRFQEVESEFANLANLFVASTQLHSSLSPRRVTRRLKEVLTQLVGAESYGVYLASPDSTKLVPIAAEGILGDHLVPLSSDSGPLGEVFSKAEAFVDEGADPSRGTLEKPPAVVPLMLDEQCVGVIAIYTTLSQKNRFDSIDFELFKLIGQHAAAALVSASLFARAERKLPGLEAFLDLSV